VYSAHQIWKEFAKSGKYLRNSGWIVPVGIVEIAIGAGECSNGECGFRNAEGEEDGRSRMEDSEIRLAARRSCALTRALSQRERENVGGAGWRREFGGRAAQTDGRDLPGPLRGEKVWQNWTFLAELEEFSAICSFARVPILAELGKSWHY